MTEVGVENGSILRAALMEGDLRFVAGYVSGRFGIEVSEEDAQRWHRLAVTQDLCPYWSDCSTLMWIKNRLSEMGRLTARHEDTPDATITCEMHVFFIGLEETPEMLIRLKGEKSVAVSQVARSKIANTLLADIRPIDAVAASVAPRPDDHP